MAEALRTIGNHLFKLCSFSDVSRGGKTVKNLPHPEFSRDQAGYENALGYYGSVATLMHNLNRIIKTDSLNDYAEGVSKGLNRDALIKARGYSGDKEAGFLFKGFHKGLGARMVSDPVNYHLNKAKDKSLSPADRQEHLKLAQAEIAKLVVSDVIDKPNTTDKEDVK